MTKKLEEVFNLGPSDLPEEVSNDNDDDDNDIEQYTLDEIQTMMEKADKIDAALPQVSGLDRVDADYDLYAKKAIEVFDDLVDLGKNVEDRHAAEIFNAASNMMSNAIKAKTNKANKKIEMIKLQLQKAKLEHEKEKLEYLKKRHINDNENADVIESEGKIITTRNDIIAEVLAELKDKKE